MSVKTLYAKLQTWANDPQIVFRFSLLICAFSTIVYTLFFTDIYRDTAHVYGPYTREFARFNWSEAIAVQVPMLNITLAGVLAMTGLEPVKALTVIAGLFFLATCLPLRKLLERYLSPLAAAWGCLLFACAPKMLRFATAPLLESSRMFFMTSAILFFLQTVENPKWKNALLFGISAGLMSAARGEGIILSFVLLLGLPFFALLFRRPRSWGKLFASWGIATVCAIAAVSPFCAMNYSRSGYFVPDARAVVLIEETVKVLKKQSVPAPASTAAPATTAAVPEQSSMQSMTQSEKCYHNFSSFIRGGYELYWLLAIIGAVVICRRKAWNNDYILLLGTALLYFVFYMATISAYRYYLFLIPLFMMFTVTGADFLRQLAVKYLPVKLHIIAIVLCAALAIGQIANGVSRAFSSKGKDFIKAGKWIEKYGKKHFPDRKLRLFSPMMSETAYWSQAELTDGFGKTIHDPATFKDFDLAVVHRKRSYGMEKRKDLQRLPDTPHSKNIWIFKLKSQENEKQ